LGVYSGDANYAGASDGSITRECFTVTSATPGVVTDPTNATITLGASDSDGATVTGTDGITPTGSVSFYVCGPTASASTCTTSSTKLGSVPVVGSGDSATATSASFTPSAAGVYCFLGVYSGDANYAGSSDGSTTRECFTVTPANPGMSTSPTSGSITLGASDSDAATITGSGVTPTGTVAFYVTTSVGVHEIGTIRVSASGVDTATAISHVYKSTTIGTYCFVVLYSGDSNYVSASDSAVPGECFTVTPRQGSNAQTTHEAHQRLIASTNNWSRWNGRKQTRAV